MKFRTTTDRYAAQIAKATGLTVTRDRAKALVIDGLVTARTLSDGIDYALNGLDFWCCPERANLDRWDQDRYLMAFLHADGDLWVADDRTH